MTDESQDLTRQFLFHVARLSLEKAFSEFDMATGIEIGGAIKSLGAAVSLAKTVMDVAKKVDNAELIKAIADLTLEMANANLGMAELTNQLAETKLENTQLKQKIKELEEGTKPNQLQLGKDKLYYSEQNEGPFCPHCHNQGERSLLTQFSIGEESYRCVKCRWRKEAP
jgi:cell division protein FtsB